jgi:DNA-binding transcriptional regulator GbsR (MarR family)
VENEPIALSPEIRRFIEAIGGWFTQYGLSRIVGRIAGLMMVVDRPLSLDDMAAALGVSRTSISTNIRAIAILGFVDQVSIPKDRRDYYQYSADPWEARSRAGIIATETLRAIARNGLAALEEEGGPQEHLEDLLDFCEFYLQEERSMMQRWRERRRQRAAAKLIEMGKRDRDQSQSG